MKKDLNTNNEVNLQKLLKVKRLETPGDAYFNGFLTEFHRYQRADILKQSTLIERLQAKLEDLFLFQPTQAWAMGSSLAVVALLVTISLANFGGTTSSDNFAQGSVPAASLPTDNIRLISDSTFERDFTSPRYVTGQTPLSYDSALAF